MTLALLLTLASVHIAVVMAPGANFLTVTQNALSYSRRSGLLTVGGVATGSSLYIAGGIIGFAALISRSALLYDLIRLVGVLYFSYMGWQLLRRKPRLTATWMTAISAVPLPDLAPNLAYRSGLMSALANPASALYFLSLFTTFIPVTSLLTDKLLAGLLLLAITVTWYTLIALTFSDARVRGLYHRTEIWMNRLFGVLWLLLALKLLIG